MSDFKIDYLANRPNCLHACAAWAYGRWGVQKTNGSLERAISVFKRYAKDKLPLTLLGSICQHLQCQPGDILELQTDESEQ